MLVFTDGRHTLLFHSTKRGIFFLNLLYMLELYQTTLFTLRVSGSDMDIYSYQNKDIQILRSILEPTALCLYHITEH